MRPKSIVLFERLVLLSIVLGIVSTLLMRQQTEAMLQSQGAPINLGTVYTIQAITVVLYLILVYFISRKGSPVAKWIYIALAVLGLLGGLVGIGATFEMGAVHGIMALAQYAITIATIYLLFRPDATAWFREGRGDGDPASH